MKEISNITSPEKFGALLLTNRLMTKVNPEVEIETTRETISIIFFVEIM